MCNNKKSLEVWETENITFSVFTDIPDYLLNVQIIDYIIYDFRKRWVFEKENIEINRWEFEGFLKDYFIKNNINLKDIKNIWIKNSDLIINLKPWGNISFNIYSYLKDYKFKNILWWKKIEYIEKRVANLNWAIEYIFFSNNFLFEWEINDKDKLKTRRFWNDLKYKNLKELKELLDKENQKLFRIYDITWESKKKQDLLKQEIKIYTWVWDEYEWWAKYFELSFEEIQNKVESLCDTMDIDQVFSYMQWTKDQMNSNFKRASSVERSNNKLINILYSYSFERLKKEDASSDKFIKLIKIMTWRWKLELKNTKDYEKMQEFDYESWYLTFEMSSNFNNALLANSILIYLIFREKWWFIERIKEKQDVNIEDDALKWRSPRAIISESKKLFAPFAEKSWFKENELLVKLWYWEYINTNKKYNELTFNEKVEIWALARIINYIKGNNLNINDIKDLDQIWKKLSEQAFKDLNESLSDNFDWYWSFLNIWSVDAKDLWLYWAEAEIFELYQDINWNDWIFDLKDDNVPWLRALSIWLGIIAWIIILWPAIAAAWAAWTFYWAALSWIVAWAKLWLVTSVISQGLSNKWYDTYEEMFLDVWSQLLIDIILSAIFTWAWLGLLKALWLKLNPDLLLSIEAWTTKAWFIDKSFIIWEVLTTMIVSGYISEEVKRKYEEFYIDKDLDNKKYNEIGKEKE